MVSPKKKIRIALIGAGGMGRRWAWAIGQLSGITCRAVSDVDIRKAKEVAQRLQDCEATADWKKALRRSDIDVAMVATPNKCLAPISTFALLHGKHVLCE